MRKLIVVASLFVCIQSISAQEIINRDPTIEKMVLQISSDSLQSYIHQLVAFGTRQVMSTLTEKQRGIGAARLWVLSKMNSFAKNSNGRMTCYLDTTTLQPDGKRIDKPTNLGNVMAVLKGTDTADHRIFLVSGHLDSRVTDVMNRTSDAPGANDDGSGVANVLECARVMSQQQFSATVIFVAVSGEEQGLLGSGFLAEKAKQQNWDIEAMLNNDIMGSNNSSETKNIDNTTVRIFSEGIPAFEAEKSLNIIRSLGLENDSKSRQLARYVKEIGERYVDNLKIMLVYRSDRFLRGGDHTPFLQRGFAAVRITELNENFNHQHQDLRMENGIEYGDLEKFMDFEYLRKNTAMNLSTLSNLAKAPSMPQNVKVDVKNLTNHTVLSWSKPKTGNVKGYYILMRETSSPVWQKKIFTTSLNADLLYSKDNYFFAVQSVNEAGNESLPVMPSVGR